MNDLVQKLTSQKKAMGKQMIKSLEAPQFQLETEVDCSRLILFRNSIEFKPTIATILAKLATEILVRYPLLNSSWGGDSLIIHETVNIGIAMDTNRGLLVPIIKNASKLTLFEFHEAMETIKSKRVTGKFSVDDLSGGTFTVSNLGIYNVTSFKAIVNVPEVGILALPKMSDKLVIRDGQITSIKIMRVCLTIDHRVVDGAYGSRYLTEFAEKIENL